MKRNQALQRHVPLRTYTPLQARTELIRTPFKPKDQQQREAGSSLTRSASIRPVSKKRQRENRDRRRMVNQLYPEQPMCTVWELASNTAVDLPAAVLAACRQWADDLHEPLSRARLGSITDEKNQAPLCRPCHDVLTFAPESTLPWAYETGLLVHSWGWRDGR